MSVATDYADFQTPGANAQAISVTGVPLLTLAGILLASQTFTIPGGGNQNTASLPITQLGYEIQLKLSIPAAATVPFVDATLMWTDNSGGNTVAQERWMLPCGSNANYIITGTGPTKGSQLVLKLSNEDPTQTATVGVIILTNSRIYRRDRWIVNTPQPVPGFTIPGGDPLREILAVIDGVNVNAGVTLTRLLPLYHGDVHVYVEEAGVAPANGSVKLQVAPTSVLGTGDMWSGQVGGGVGAGVLTFQRFPRAPTLLSYTNNGSVAATFTAKVIMLDDKQ